MKDKKTIWHGVDVKPKNGKMFIYKNLSGWWFSSVCWENAVQKNTIVMWIYEDDLLEQPNKVESLESEVSRYKNSLEVAEKALKYYHNKGKHITDEEYDNYKDHGFCKSKTAGVVVDHRIARDALKEIDTAKQKGPK